ncbi:MAG: 6-phosphogluconolactonase [Flavisolibacter sp.]
MNIQVFPTYDALSNQAADDLIALLAMVDQPLVCVASGDSPAGLYKELVYRVKNNEADISELFFVGLDEWAGMNGDDEGSCRFHLNNQFFKPLQIREERIGFFDGRSNNPEEECTRIENFIRQHGGIDVAILGLGMNGHVGMNEPGTPPQLHSHVTKIDPLTQKVGQKYFSQQKELSHGLTLGLATLKEAKHIMLIVNGEHKASIVHQVLEGKISEELPASLFRHHASITIYLDKSAAQLISSYEQRNFRD